MKNIGRVLSLLVLLGTISLSYGGAVPPVEIIVSNASGKVAFKGTTGAGGTFVTGNQEAGNYVVQFNSKSPGVKGSKFSLAITSGKNVVSADAITGEKLADNGVAMKIAVAAGKKITGRVTPGAVPPESVGSGKAAWERQSNQASRGGPLGWLGGSRRLSSSINAHSYGGVDRLVTFGT